MMEPALCVLIVIVLAVGAWIAWNYYAEEESSYGGATEAELRHVSHHIDRLIKAVKRIHEN